MARRSRATGDPRAAGGVESRRGRRVTGGPGAVFHVKRDAEIAELRRQGERLGVSLAREAAARLLTYETLLRERALPAGMVGRRDAPWLRERHILDCLRAVQAVEATDRTAADLGSGAGLPGIVVATVLPELRVALVERRRRRAGFLELAVERLGLENVEIVVAELDRLDLRVDLCFARALAPPSDTWRLAAPLLAPGGRLVYFAGKRSGGRLEVPGVRLVRMIEHPMLEGAGPLAIMSRQ